ncbi:uncharacterized protein B0I36DRAFT_426095 [Microdochium trichocladiopsis]|uniref:DUF7068 domain-containing protein n=1 Tax=Microdochium trichocladiopsis TaxID=1682393 RepID=A0A9P8XRT0_9PEZI|nr:uncharacterized protein B0I36DRAFT_426095 [Microdochium trichocladiopsis]KAH7010610.1 hypothetical protein B0I36DRAFT_426095 [Microdochium trichocladiopsis]
MSRFLNELLKQPNVIITSRPSAKPPPALDLELETIGFYQIKAFTNRDTGKVDLEKTEKVQSFLQSHWLIQGLVRIPIQLDALCYTWDDFDPGSVPDTMTGMYKAIEQKLWKKDAVRLGKTHSGQPVTAAQIGTSDPKFLVEDEIYFLERLAFTGLHNDVIDFTSEHRGAIPNKLLLDKTLPQLSFLRTSDPSPNVRDREYHFTHLTFQEYFAARCFVRHWKDDSQLEYVFKKQSNTQSDSPTDPAKFFRKQKYSARYDVFWRFVAGLLDAEKDNKTLQFFKMMEQEPLDLLGPTHQRLQDEPYFRRASSQP